MDFDATFWQACQIPNRGNTHIFLGHPLSDLCDKTTVEPGNTYSPGVWTCGVSFGLIVDGKLYLPDRISEQEICWGFGVSDGFPPLVQADYQVKDIGVSHILCTLAGEGAEGVDFSRVWLKAAVEKQITACILVKDVGPAGGKVKQLDWFDQEQVLQINQSIRLVIETPPMSCHITNQEDGTALAIIFADMLLHSKDDAEVRFKTEHGFDDRLFASAIPKKRPYANMSVPQAFEEAVESWHSELPARVFAPDPRIARVWEASAYHIMAAMEAGLPRIGVVNYPIFWMRDGVIILRALDLIGRHDLARLGCDYLAPLDFSGGFGAESDAPGEGIWTLVCHAQMQPDLAWLRGVFPHIFRRIGWLQKMRTTAVPLRAMVENRTASTYHSPGSTILCLASQDGVIHGRMDFHSPDFYINCWALAGFRQAVWAAGQLGETQIASTWQAELEEYERVVYLHLLPQYGNERDPVVSPYPTQALSQSPYHQALCQKFEQWYRANRLDATGKRQREALWTYFEAAQIHNAIQLGFKAEAWACLDGMLDDACQPWNVAAWIEGAPGGNEMLPFHNTQGARGWLNPERAIAGNMPHNWTGGEMLALLRTIFVLEQDDGLVLGAGVPEAWLQPGSRFGINAMPTCYGPVSYTVTVDGGGKPVLAYKGPQNYQVSW